jgi:DNA-binding response OmpR family regulator
MNILLIEPDTVLAKTYQTVLQESGLNARYCHDGQHAVYLIEEQKPDAIILEPLLAAHSGIDFLHEFRSYEDWVDIPVFILSSVPEYSYGVDQKTWDRLGVKRYFYKPNTSVRHIAGIIKSYSQSGV